MKTEASKKTLGLYLHIPFCVQKCLYCDFCSFAGSLGKVSDYIHRLCFDIGEYGEKCGDYEVDTVYFGGGTPTLLPIKELDKIFDAVSHNFKIKDNAEISAECNPATADLDYFKSMRSIGINRLSIGLQSTHDNELRALGRIHTYSDFLDTYKNARSAGFDNISADLMYGIPEQTYESFSDTLKALVSISPEHISSYGLKIEDGTPFGKIKNKLVLPDEDTEYDMYRLLSHYLLGNGYAKYEISNFSQKGRESRHNVKYWRGDDYIGIGVAAHSYFEGVRFSNSRDFEAYINNADITDSKREITPNERQTEFVMLGMRLSCGVNKSEFFARFGVSFFECYGERIKKYIDNGYVVDNGDNIFFTDKGFFVSNYILSDILDFD